MLSIKGIYENGIVKLDKPINVNKPLKVIITFIDEEIQINYQVIDKKEEKLLSQIEAGLKDVKKIKEGKSPAKTLKEMLNEQ